MIEQVLRYWSALRLRILIALDTTEADAGEFPETDVLDIPDNPDG